MSKLKLILIGVLSLISFLFLNSCSSQSQIEKDEQTNNNHIHNVLESWQFDEKNHWQIATCCDQLFNKSPHIMETIEIKGDCMNKTIVVNRCQVCGYQEAKELDYEKHVPLEYFMSYDDESHVKTCLNCGQILEKEKHKFVLDNNDIQCGIDSVNVYYTCSDCGYAKSINVKPEYQKHDFYHKFEVEPTLTTPGIVSVYCTHCSYGASTTIPAIENWGLYTIEPTCTEDGKTYRQYYVQIGGSYDLNLTAEEKIIPKLEHDYGEYEVVENPTFKKEGLMRRICKRDASHIDEYVLPIINKENYEYNIIDAPTCTKGGLASYTLEVGEQKYEYIEMIDSLGHNYQSKIIEPTCSNKGYTLNTCSRCQDWYIDNIKLVSEHKFSTYSILSEPSCIEVGEKVSVCELCDKKVIEIIPALGHISMDGLTCDRCDISMENDECLNYELSEDGTYYIVKGLNLDVIMDVNKINIPSYHNGLPVREIANNAFENIGIIEVVFNPNLEKIGDYAFSGSKINYLYIYSTLGEIGSCAFYNTEISNLLYYNSINSLLNIKINDKYGSLFNGNSQFYLNDQLIKELVIPSNVKTIRYNTLNNAPFESIIITGNLEIIEYYGISNLPNLKQIIIDSVDTIKNYAICNNPNLEKITIKKINQLNGYAICDNAKLISVEIANEVNIINELAIVGDSIEEIILPAKVNEINDGAFSTPNIKQITLPYVGNNLNDINKHFSIIFSKNDTYYKVYDGNFNEVYLPRKLTDITVLGGKINSFSFMNAHNLLVLKVGPNVTEISNDLSLVTGIILYYLLPDLAENIVTNFDPQNAYEICNLTQYDLTTNVYNYKKPKDSKIIYDGDYIFYDYNDKKTLIGYLGDDINVELPNLKNEYYLRKNLFYSYKDLATMTVPAICYGFMEAFGNYYDSFNTIYYLGTIENYFKHEQLGYLMDYGNVNYVYVNGEKLVDVEIPEGVTKLESYILYDLDIESIKFPSSLVECHYLAIGSNDLLKAINVTSLYQLITLNVLPQINNYIDIYVNDVLLSGEISIPENVEVLETRSLYKIKNIERINIPNTVKYIASEAIADLPDLKEVYYLGTLEEYQFLDSSLSFENQCEFYVDNINVKSYEELVILNGVESVPSKYYDFINLKVVYLPASINYVGYKPFYNIEKLYFAGTIDEYLNISFSTFDGFSTNYELIINDELIHDIVIPEGIINLNGELISGARNITSITFNKDIKDIGIENLPNLYMLDFSNMEGGNSYYSFYTYLPLLMVVYLPEDSHLGISFSAARSLVHIYNNAASINTNNHPAYIEEDGEFELIDDFIFYNSTAGLSLVKYIGDSLDVVLPKMKVLYKINTYAFTAEYLNSLTIPSNKSLLGFSQDIFTSYPTINNMYFDGTFEEFNQLVLESQYYSIDTQNVYFKNSDGEYELVKDLVISPNIVRLQDYVLTYFNFESITIPKTLISFGNNTFGKLTYYDGTIEDYLKLSFSDEVDTYVLHLKNDEGEYYELYSDTVKIPRTVRHINDYAFYTTYNIVITIEIPLTVEKISINAFSTRTGLINIYYEGTEEQFMKITSYAPWVSAANIYYEAKLNY